jgi:hypothetical protein
LRCWCSTLCAALKGSDPHIDQRAQPPSARNAPPPSMHEYTENLFL